jgi:glycosyltransferase involved in cell wall biosynthesis
MKSMSILMPVYNGGRTLNQFLESLLIQNIPHDIKNIEFLIGDDGSNDSSINIINTHLNSLKNKFSVKIISHRENMGWRYTLANLYEKSEGEIIVFIDSDAIPANDNWLRELTEKIIGESNQVVQGNFWAQLDTNSFSSRQHERWRKSVYLSRFRKADGTLGAVNTRNLAISRMVIEDIKKNFGYFLDPRSTLAGADTKLGFQISELGYLIHLNELAIVRHADPVTFSGIIKQKIKHGYLDGTIGIYYKNNFYNSIYIPFRDDNVSLFFSVLITLCFGIANLFGYLQYKFSTQHA